VTKKVLIVEDDESIRDLFQLYLVRFHAEMYEASNGIEALGMLKEVSPALIITDLSMPLMDGITLIKAVRGHIIESLRSIPILAITGGDNAAKEAAVAAGANSVLGKTMHNAEIRQIVGLLLK